MDKVREKKQGFLTKSRMLGVIAGVAVLSTLYWLNAADVGSYAVSRDRIDIGTVRQGPFSVTVRGSGVLVPKNVSIEASSVVARVDKLMIKAGAHVKSGDPLVLMSNPELEQRKAEMQWEIEAIEAENEAKEVTLKSQILDQESLLLDLSFKHERVSLRIDAEAKLLAQGNNTVSMLEHQENLLSKKQYEQQLIIEKQRLANLNSSFETQKRAFAARTAKLQKTLELAQRQLDALTVRASIDGVVQSMPVEVGQRVVIGSNIAKIANHDSLVCELKITELQIANVAIGQTVDIDTRNSKIKGKITRIAPVVVEGDVVVEVALEGPLPQDVRPELSVNGVITVSSVNSTTFVERPYFAQSNRLMNVYRLDDSGYAEQVEVEFGIGSADSIEVTRGLRPGEEIVLSDTSLWASHKVIKIN